MFLLCSCVPSFITLYLSHFPMYCGDKSIHNFIYFATQFCDLQGHLWIATSAVLLLMMWQNAEQKVTVELNAASAFPTWLEPLLRGSAHTCSRVSVYSRERMWSKMANIADSFPRLPPHPTPPTAASVGQRARTQSVNLLFIMETDFPRDRAVWKIWRRA